MDTQSFTKAKTSFLEFLKKHKIGTENIAESLIAPTLINRTGLKDILFLDIFPFACSRVVESNQWSHSTYKTPIGSNYDAYSYEEGWHYRLEGVSFSDEFMGSFNPTYLAGRLESAAKPYYGQNLFGVERLLIDFFSWHQKFFPITLICSSGVYPCLLSDCEFITEGGRKFCNITLKQTSYLPPDKLDSKGKPTTKKITAKLGNKYGIHR